MYMPGVYGQVSMQNSNPTSKKDGFSLNPDSPLGGGGEHSRAMKKCENPFKDKNQEKDRKTQLKVLLFTNHIPTPQPLCEADDHSGDSLLQQDTHRMHS